MKDFISSPKFLVVLAVLWLFAIFFFVPNIGTYSLLILASAYSVTNILDKFIFDDKTKACVLVSSGLLVCGFCLRMTLMNTDINRCSPGYMYVGKYVRSHSGSSREPEKMCYSFSYQTDKKKDITIEEYDSSIINSEIDTAIIFVSEMNNYGKIIIPHPQSTEIEKYRYPVKCTSYDYEIGNDSWEYARHGRDLALVNFGMNVVFTGNKIGSKLICIDYFDGKTKYVNLYSYHDRVLIYSNINPKFFDGWHVCPDSLCTSENFAKVEEGGYGYIFRGKIYSKDETEKYWNIIEQYKLREGAKKQLFNEAPLAKEYYEKYCRE